jgi:hypothetical protein
LATRFKAFTPSGHNTVSAAVTGATLQGSQHLAVVVNDRNALCSLLVFVAGIADAVPAFFGDGVGASAMQDAAIELVVRCPMPHPGDEGLLKGAVIRPPDEDFVDGRLVEGWLTLGVWRDGQALPLHPCIEHREDEVEDAVRAEFTFGPTLGHREGREEKFRELRGGELTGIGVVAGFAGAAGMMNWPHMQIAKIIV